MTDMGGIVNWSVLSTNYLFLVADQPPFVTISNSRFSSNSRSGITIYNLIGQLLIDNTMVSNGGVGLHVNGSQGDLAVYSTKILHNKKHGIHVSNGTGSVSLKTVNSSNNQGSGLVFETETIALKMSDCQSEGNNGQGLHILNQLNSIVNVSNTVVRNSGYNGIYLQDIFEDSHVYFSEVISSKNSQNGAFFERLKASLSVSTSSFNGNSIHGVLADEVETDNFSFQRVSASNNYRSGVFVHRGESNLTFDALTSTSNSEDGFHLEGQKGELNLKDCVTDGNKRYGLALFDSHYARLESIRMQNCSILGSVKVGVIIQVYSNVPIKNDSYSISIWDSLIANNTQGGVYVYRRHCSYYSYSLRRHVRLSFIRNEVNGNQNYGLYFLGPEEYELNALLRNNVFRNNVGSTLRVDGNCRVSKKPVKVNILSNTFRNNKGEHVILVDFKYLPDKRYATIYNNTFMENQGVRSFASRYSRIKSQAVVTMRKGNVTVESNLFDNPSIAHDIATLFQDSERVINARGNWWGSLDECKIKARIFDFEDRVDLAKIQYYPFLDSNDSTKRSFHQGARGFCFLEGNKIGGILDREVTLYKNNASYEVIGDVIVLSNGTLTIEANVTLEFPLQAVFFVQGQVDIKGTETERVHFIPKNPLQKEVRLVDGTGPWEGRLQIWLNDTWMSVCKYRVNYLSATACRQLGYDAYTSSFRYANGREKLFLHNVQCDSNENDNIMSCNRDKWFSQATCSSYVFYVHCQNPYWSGVHLAITAKKSVIRNVDINYAGFSYRNDLNIPGSALRVDLTHHEVSRIVVNNSANVGLHVVYPQPFKTNTPDIQNSTITNTISNGIQLESPYLSLMKVEVMKTDGRGFQYFGSNWGAINTHVIKLADPQVKKYINLCYENATFLNDDSLQYYLIVSAGKTHICETVLKVPSDYRIGMQLTYDALGSTFHVYSGTNMTASTPWEINKFKWYNRPIWLSNSSSVLLKSSSYYSNYRAEVHFLLFLVKGRLLCNFFIFHVI